MKDINCIRSVDTGFTVTARGKYYKMLVLKPSKREGKDPTRKIKIKRFIGIDDAGGFAK